MLDRSLSAIRRRSGRTWDSLAGMKISTRPRSVTLRNRANGGDWIGSREACRPAKTNQNGAQVETKLEYVLGFS